MKAVLPDPSSLGVGYKGKTCIGCMMEGVKDGKPVKHYIYNVCDHAECFKEVQSQAISYTTGVPAMKSRASSTVNMDIQQVDHWRTLRMGLDGDKNIKCRMLITY